MKYSINPFKWLLWLCRRMKWRKSGFLSYCNPKPLSNKGKAEVWKKIKAEYDKMDWVGIPEWVVGPCKPYGS